MGLRCDSCWKPALMLFRIETKGQGPIWVCEKCRYMEGIEEVHVRASKYSGDPDPSVEAFLDHLRNA
jgi:ribosomal protein L37AE/L43A